jgi:hypothetical protein
MQLWPRKIAIQGRLFFTRPGTRSPSAVNAAPAGAEGKCDLREQKTANTPCAEAPANGARRGRERLEVELGAQDERPARLHENRL